MVGALSDSSLSLLELYGIPICKVFCLHDFLMGMEMLMCSWNAVHSFQEHISLSALFGKAWTLSAFITVKNHGPPLADPSCVLLLPCDPGRGSSCTEQELWISTWARPGQKLFFFFLRITMHRNSPHLILSLYILSNEFFKVKCVNSRTHANNSMSCLTKDLAAQVIG